MIVGTDCSKQGIGTDSGETNRQGTPPLIV